MCRTKGNNHPQLSVQRPPNWHQCPPLSDLAPSLHSVIPPVPFCFENTEQSIFDQYDQSSFQSFTSAVDIDPLSKSFRPLLLCTFILALLNPLQYSKTLHLRISILTRLPCASEKVSSLAPAHHINNAWCIFSVLNVYDWNIYWKQKSTKERYHLVLVSQYGTWAIKHFRIRIICHISKQIFKIKEVENILKCKTHFTAGHLFESHSCKLLWSWTWIF